MQATFIGDVHGKYQQYKTLIKSAPNTIQIGDMGIGFRRWPHGEFSSNPPYDTMVETGARFIRGNHDNPNVCAHHTQWIPDGTYDDGVMLIGGAFSIDHMYRVEDFSWWKNEELSYEQFEILMALYNSHKPTVMVTHDCPLSIIPMMHSHPFKDNSRTQVALQKLLDIHKPKLWVYGHHHKSFDVVIEGTRFVCLAELEMKDLQW